MPALLVTLAAICALFAVLLELTELPGASQVGFVCAYLVLSAVAIAVAPGILYGASRYVVTDRRVMWKRGKMRRSIETYGITFSRIRWNRAIPTVGDIELVRAVPFGPLARQQRVVLHNVEAPDAVLSIIRGVEPSEHAGDHTTPLTDRLDPDEEVLWGAAPDGVGIDWRDVLTTLFGLGVLFVGLPAAVRTAAILANLEEHGLPIHSYTWVLLFVAMALTATLILSIGVVLTWHGILRARAMGRDTEYVLTDRRILIRRGRTELSIARQRVVDVAETRDWRGLTRLYLVLDGPEARALADSGALSVIAPSRDAMMPVLYDLEDVADVRSLLATRTSRPSLPHAA
ncbi:MAG: hypothetical protein H6719_24410 [Sandaracinaceae bacterium]|nr:hypothetical protein [Sandaracinaceae bacterium]